jgi:hypothetical protein
MPRSERSFCPGFFANHGRWKGLDMGPLLEKAKVKPGATHVIFSGPEGSGEKVARFSIKEIRANAFFWATASTGRPFPGNTGFPFWWLRRIITAAPGKRPRRWLLLPWEKKQRRKIMLHSRKPWNRSLFVFAMILIMISGTMALAAEEAGLSRAVFHVA